MGDWKVRDYREKDLSLEEIVLGERTLKPEQMTEEDWHEFHFDYVRHVGSIVGFYRPPKKKKNKLFSWEKVFDRIFKEYHDPKNALLQGIFGSYADFFNAFFIAPYGLRYNKDKEGESKYDDLLSNLREKLDACGKGRAEQGLEKEVKIFEFVRGLNLPVLMRYCIDAFGSKAESHLFGEECRIGLKRGEVEIKTILKPRFPSSIWDNLFSSYEDCMTVTVDPVRPVKDSKTGEAEKCVTFQQYWFATLLHAINPHISYINFVTDHKGIELPLFRAKLVEASSRFGRKYLVMGGLLGGSVEEVLSFDSVASYIDDGLTDFVKKKFGKKTRFVYNREHASGRELSYNRFIEYKTGRIIVNDRRRKKEEERGKRKGTHRLKVDLDEKTVMMVSNFVAGEGGAQKYRGEQYSETFERNKKKYALGAFTGLEGVVNCLDPWRETGITYTQIVLAEAAIVIASVAGYIWLYGGANGSDHTRQAELVTQDYSAPACSVVEEDPGWVAGETRAKRLDFDGDGKSDIVLWRKGEFKLDLSRLGGLGGWDAEVTYRDLPGEHFWPFVEDMDSDGREDFVLYVSDTGTWYVKFMRFPIQSKMNIEAWDLIIPSGVGSACKARLDMDMSKSVYGRPLPGDYNGDGWVDLAVVCSDGLWRIDYGGHDCGVFGAVDEQVRFLDETRLVQAPGWAYLPIFDEVPGGRRVMAYKVPDTLPDAGSIVTVRASGIELPGSFQGISRGNSDIIIPGSHTGSSLMIPFLTSKGWKAISPDGSVVSVTPQGLFQYPRCLPVLGDFDGDNIDDAAAYCGDEWLIMNSSAQQQPHAIARIALGLPRGEEYLPGVIFFGGGSYQYVKQLMGYSREVRPGVPVPIPVDMMRVQNSILLLESKGEVSAPFYMTTHQEDDEK